jgi:hypothetical protein
LRRGACLAVAALSLAGCGAFNTERPPPCLPVVVLRDAAQLVNYRPGEGRDLTDVVAQARFTRFATKCDYSAGEVEVELLLDIMIEQGPAATDRVARVPYFVAIIDTDQKILAKEVFQSIAQMPEGQRRAIVREETEQVIPIASVDDRIRYEIMIGFQLTEEQLEENRKRQR